MTQDMPAVFMAMGACSLEEPQPKFLSATIMSPSFIFFTNSGSASSMQCFASSFGSDVFKYLAGIIWSVSTSAPNFHALPLNFIQSPSCLSFLFYYLIRFLHQFFQINKMQLTCCFNSNKLCQGFSRY